MIRDENFLFLEIISIRTTFVKFFCTSVFINIASSFKFSIENPRNENFKKKKKNYRMENRREIIKIIY